MKLGFAGLGRMGRPMAANCANAGHDVTIWNRSIGPVADFVAAHRAKAAQLPCDLAAGTDLVVMMLANDEAA